MKRTFAYFLIWAGIVSAAESRPTPWSKSTIAAGQDLYRNNCVVCHDIDKDRAHSRKFGPSLQHLSRIEKFPSGAKPTRPYVTVRIKFGGVLMPAFKDKLTDQEINTLIDYIESK